MIEQRDFSNNKCCKPGIVYLIRCGEAFKIGFTTESVQKRMSSLQTGNGFKLEEVCCFKTDFGQKLETTVHKHFASKRIRGEWFSLEEKDVEGFILTCASIENNFRILRDNPFF